METKRRASEEEAKEPKEAKRDTKRDMTVQEQRDSGSGKGRVGEAETSGGNCRIGCAFEMSGIRREADAAGMVVGSCCLGCRYRELSSNDWATWWMEASETIMVMKAEVLASLEAEVNAVPSPPARLARNKVSASCRTHTVWIR